MLTKLLSWIKHIFIKPETSSNIQSTEITAPVLQDDLFHSVIQEDKSVPITAPNLASLLLDIDKTFKKLKVPAWTSFTSKEVRAGLTKMGPMVIPSKIEWAEKRNVNINSFMPSMVYLATQELSEYDKEGCTYPSFFYAVKHERLPPECQHLKGIVYETGFAYEYNKRMRWFGLFVTVDSVTGKVKIAKTPMKKACHIPLSKRKKGDEREVVFSRKAWDIPEIVSVWAAEQHVDMEEYADKLGEIFAVYINIWQQRADYWRVAVKNNNSRLTFLINAADPKTFFKDRGVTATTKTGQKKKILHFVTEHTRTINEKPVQIKEHIRGLRIFNWKGHACSILAPQFHRFNSDTFTAAAITEDETESSTKSMSLERGAKLIAELEDTQIVPFDIAA